MNRAWALPSLAWFSFALAQAATLAAIFLLVSHFSRRATAVVAVLVGATTPLFYARNPAAPGRDVIMAAVSVAVSGLALGVLGRGARRTRVVAAALGVGGLAGCALAGAGALVVTVPAATVGLTWAFTGRAREGRAGVLIACAAAAAALGLAWLGRPDRSFEAPLAVLGRSCFPWSALFPFALAAMTELPAPPAAAPSELAEIERASVLRVLVLSGAVLSYAASAWFTQRQPLSGLIFVAGAVALWFGDVRRGARVSGPALFASAVLAALIGLDFVRFPEQRALSFAPGLRPSQLAELAPAESSAPPYFRWAMGLVMLGAAMGGTARLAPFVGALLAALILRFGYYPATSAARSPSAALAAFEDRAAHDRHRVRAGTLELR